MTIDKGLQPQDMLKEFETLSASIFDWINERELLNFFQIMEHYIPNALEVARFGEHIQYKDPFESEYKWKGKTILKFKGTVDIMTGELTIGVGRVFIGNLEPVYYKFKMTSNGVGMI